MMERYKALLLAFLHLLLTFDTLINEATNGGKDCQDNQRSRSETPDLDKGAYFLDTLCSNGTSLGTSLGEVNFCRNTLKFYK
jgi:hypothetical protein